MSCGTLNIFVNQEISVLFSQAVDLSTVTKSTFQLTEVSTGKAPTGSFSLDPKTPARVIFRPLLTFDSAGSPVFGLEANESYTLRIPGALQDPPPYIESTTGQRNRTRVLCTVAATGGGGGGGGGVDDLVPGAPTSQVLVDVVTATDASGSPTEFALGVPAQGAVDVWRDSKITFVFDDLMNPATLVNPVTGESDFLRVAVDPDGNVADDSDQVELAGSYTIDLDQTALTTVVTFTSPRPGCPRPAPAL